MAITQSKSTIAWPHWVAILSLVLFLWEGPGYEDPRNAYFDWLVSAAEAAGQGGPRPTNVTPGLMWNRSGLPAVFPLQVKTSTGQDYFLTLIDTETGKDTLAAFIIGGEFFKVLVPPGTFVVRFAAGDIWQGETTRFGPGTMTTVFELEQSLRFSIAGPGMKAGHLVDLTGNARGQLVTAKVKSQSICQALDTEFTQPWEYLYYRQSRRYRWTEYRYRNPRAVRALDQYRYSFPEYFPLHMFYPRYSVRSRFCG